MRPSERPQQSPAAPTHDAGRSVVATSAASAASAASAVAPVVVSQGTTRPEVTGAAGNAPTGEPEFPPSMQFAHTAIGDTALALSPSVLLSGHAERITDGSIFSVYQDDNPWLVLVLVLFSLMLKVVATSITVGAGGNGGMFGSSLFAGALAGFFFARLRPQRIKFGDGMS